MNAMNAIDSPHQDRYPGGYQWFDADTVVQLQARAPVATASIAESDFVLSTGLAMGAYNFETYSPPLNLFLLFAETRDTKEDIKRFADGYGLLGLNDSEGAVVLAIEPEKGVVGTGEMLSAWRRELCEMRRAVRLWSALREAQSGDVTVLSEHIRWPRNDLVYYDSHPDRPIPPETRLLGILGPYQKVRTDDKTDDLRTFAVIASKTHNPEWLRCFRVDDCLMPAKYYLQRNVNQQLKTRVSPQLLGNVRRNRPDTLALFFVPQSLLGLMWLQLAEAVNGNRGYRQCSACKTWMVISPEGSGQRSSRFTCSNACRMKVYYGRIVEAQRLAQQGRSIPEIAQRLNTTHEKVRGWIERRIRPAGGGSRNQRSKPLIAS